MALSNEASRLAPRTPRAWASNDTWLEIARDLARLGICRAIERGEIAERNGQKVLGGTMGVSKSCYDKG